jgi:facilitated trehalose transporter
VGAAKVISIFLTEFFIDKSGRKILLILSSISMTICLFLLGLFYVLKDINVDYVEHLGWLPVTALSVFAVSNLIEIK